MEEEISDHGLMRTKRHIDENSSMRTWRSSGVLEYVRASMSAFTTKTSLSPHTDVVDMVLVAAEPEDTD